MSLLLQRLLQELSTVPANVRTITPALDRRLAPASRDPGRPERAAGGDLMGTALLVALGVALGGCSTSRPSHRRPDQLPAGAYGSTVRTC